MISNSPAISFLVLSGPTHKLATQIAVQVGVLAFARMIRQVNQSKVALSAQLIPKCTNADSRGGASARPSSQKRAIIQWDAQVLAQEVRDRQWSAPLEADRVTRRFYRNEVMTGCPKAPESGLGMLSSLDSRAILL